MAAASKLMLSGIYRVSVSRLNHIRREGTLTDLCQQRRTDETVLLKCAESGLHPGALEKAGICETPRRSVSAPVVYD